MSTERAQDKWDAKAGIAPKTYKLNIAVAAEFKEVCDKLHKGQGPVITKLMQDFIEQNK